MVGFIKHRVVWYRLLKHFVKLHCHLGVAEQAITTLLPEETQVL